MKFLLLLIVVVPWEPLVVLVVVYVARKAGLVTARSLPTLSLASWFTLPSYLRLIRWSASLAQERPRECSGSKPRRSARERMKTEKRCTSAGNGSREPVQSHPRDFEGLSMTTEGL